MEISAPQGMNRETRTALFFSIGICYIPFWFLYCLRKNCSISPTFS